MPPDLTPETLGSSTLLPKDPLAWTRSQVPLVPFAWLVYMGLQDQITRIKKVKSPRRNARGCRAGLALAAIPFTPSVGGMPPMVAAHCRNHTGVGRGGGLALEGHLKGLAS